MATAVIIPSNADLDFLLAHVAGALQLTPTQFELMTQHYGAVGEWLAAPDSPIARLHPRIYPQGSVAIGTTVKPRDREEYDLDFVCEMDSSGMSAIEVYESVYRRLLDHEVYATMLDRKNRCVRLNYEHDFHLDIIPAEPDFELGGTAVLVPDRSVRDWTPSNPRGYANWFTARSAMLISEARKMAPLPSPKSVEDKPALEIAVQLMKRMRDEMSDDGDVAPRSILLTTLAAEAYRGARSVGDALREIAIGIRQRVDDAAPGRIEVCNPANSGERFCESLEDPGRYEAFMKYVDHLEMVTVALLETQGIPALTQLLDDVFGEAPVATAVRKYGEALKAKRDSQALKFSGRGTGALGIVTGSASTKLSVPSNAYFGDGE